MGISVKRLMRIRWWHPAAGIHSRFHRQWVDSSGTRHNIPYGCVPRETCRPCGANPIRGQWRFPGASICTYLSAGIACPSIRQQGSHIVQILWIAKIMFLFHNSTQNSLLFFMRKRMSNWWNCYHIDGNRKMQPLQLQKIRRIGSNDYNR